MKYSEEGTALTSYKRNFDNHIPELSKKKLPLRVSREKDDKSFSIKEPLVPLVIAQAKKPQPDVKLAKVQGKSDTPKVPLHLQEFKKPLQVPHQKSKPTELEDTKIVRKDNKTELVCKTNTSLVKHPSSSSSTPLCASFSKNPIKPAVIDDKYNNTKVIEEPGEEMEEKKIRLPQSNWVMKQKPKPKLKGIQNLDEPKQTLDIDPKRIRPQPNLLSEPLKPKIKPKPPQNRNSSLDSEKVLSEAPTDKVEVKLKSQPHLAFESEYKPKIKPKPKPSMTQKPELKEQEVRGYLNTDKKSSEGSAEKMEVRLKKFRLKPVLTEQNQDIPPHITQKDKPRSKMSAAKSLDLIDSNKPCDSKSVSKRAQRKENRLSLQPEDSSQKSQGKPLLKTDHAKKDTTTFGDEKSKSANQESREGLISALDKIKEKPPQMGLKPVQKQASQGIKEYQKKPAIILDKKNPRSERVLQVKSVKDIKKTLNRSTHSEVEVTTYLQTSAKKNQSRSFSQLMENPTYDGLEVVPLKILHNPTYDGIDLKESQDKSNEAKISKESQSQNQSEVSHEYDYPSITITCKHSKEKVKDDSPSHIYEAVEESNYAATTVIKGNGMEHADKENKSQSGKKKPLMPPNKKHQQQKEKEKDNPSLYYAVTSILRSGGGGNLPQAVNSSRDGDPHTYAILESSPTHKSIKSDSNLQRASIRQHYAVLEGPTPVSDDENDKPDIGQVYAVLEGPTPVSDEENDKS